MDTLVLFFFPVILWDSIDGSEIRQTHQLRLVDYPIIYRVLYIPSGAGFQPSAV